MLTFLVKKAVSSAYVATMMCGEMGKSAVYKAYSSGDSVEPCGTHSRMEWGVERADSQRTRNFLFWRKETRSRT